MDTQNAEYDIADRIGDSAAPSGNLLRPNSLSGYVGRVAGLCMTEHMTSAPPGPRGRLQYWVLLAALVFCVGQSVADTHLHLDEHGGHGGHGEQACTLCAIFEPGHVPDTGSVETRPSEWRRSNNVPVFSATLSPRPYEVGCPRAPPIS